MTDLPTPHPVPEPPIAPPVDGPTTPSITNLDPPVNADK